MSATHEKAVEAALALRAIEHLAAAATALQELARALHSTEEWAFLREVGRVEELLAPCSSRMTALAPALVLRFAKDPGLASPEREKFLAFFAPKGGGQ